jgi:undecaprenyl-phosphate 4-deoxy-4-formamido-L-arabinose transferase
MGTEPSVSVVIPVYNSEGSVAEVVNRVHKTMRATTDYYEVILVDDGSRDRSWEAVAQLASEHPFVTGIRLMRNYGQHNAVLCGIRAARYPVIVTIDDDGQNPPEEIPKLLQKLAEDFDVVYGTPEVEQHGFLRDLASKLTKMALFSSMGAETARSVSAFRAFRTSMRDAFAHFGGPHACVDVLLTWGTARFGAVAVQHDPRRHGESNYTFRSLLRHAINMTTGFSTAPLRIASLIGFAFTAFGGALLLVILLRYLISGSAVPGFAFLASTITILSGAQLFALGVIGEYLARMYSRMMDRPSYAVLCQIDEEHPAQRERPSAARAAADARAQ